jgi:hypothetical protein
MRPRPSSFAASLVLALVPTLTSAGAGRATDWTQRPALPLASSAATAGDVPFVPHRDAGEHGSYLAVNLRFAEFAALRRGLEARLGQTLEHRGEAHITVITPVEFRQVLSPHLSIEEVEAAAGAIQGARFAVVCLGRGQSAPDGRAGPTYYVVLDAPALVAARQRVFDLYVARGGEPSLFDPAAYHPHVTLGFTRRDLHVQDGVFKGRNSCFLPLAPDAA